MADTVTYRPVTPLVCPQCHALWLFWPKEQSGGPHDSLNLRSPTACHYCERADPNQLERLGRFEATAPVEAPVYCTPTEHEGRILYEHTDEPIPNADSFRLYASPAIAPTVSAFPERDTTRPAEEQGVFRKFDVRRVDGSDRPGGKHHGCEYFTLDIDHDPHAPAALLAYAQACAATHPHLSADLMQRYGLSAPEGAPTPTKVTALQETYEVRRIAYLAGEVWLTAHSLEVPQQLEAGDLVRLVLIERQEGGGE